MQLLSWAYNSLPNLRGKQPVPLTPQQNCESALAAARGLLRQLTGTALADPEPLRQLIAAAEPHANGSRYSEALNALGDYQKVYNEQAGKAKEQRDRLLQVAKWKPLYEDQLKTAQEIQFELERMPMPDLEYTSLLKMQIPAAGRKAGANPPDYKGAYDLIKTFDNAYLAQGKKASDMVVVNLTDSLDFGFGVEEARDAIERLEKVGLEGAGAEFRKELAQIVQDVAKRRKDGDQGKEEAYALAERVDEATKRQTKVKEKFDLDARAVDVKLGKLAEIAPVEATMAVQKALERGGAMAGNRDYVKGDEELKAADRDADAKLLEITPFAERWKAKAGAMTALLNEGNRLCVPKVVAARAGQAVLDLVQARDVTAKTLRDYITALAAVERIDGEITAIKLHLQPYLDLEPTRARAKIEVQAEVDKVQTELNALYDRMLEVRRTAGKDPVGKHFGTLTDELNTIRGDWNDRVQTARSAEELNAAQAISDLRALALKIKNLPELEIGNLIKQAKGQDDRAVYRHHVTPVADLLRQAREMGSPEADRLTAKFQTIDNDAPKNYTAGVEALGVLTGELRSLIVTLEREQTRVRGAAKRKVQETAEKIEELAIAGGIDDETSKHLMQLADDVKDLDEMCDSPTVDVIKDVEAEADAILARAQKIHDNALNATPGGATFELVKERTTAMQNQLRARDLTAYVPVALGKVQVAFNQFKETLKGLDPTQCLLKLQEFEPQITAVVDAANAAKTKREQIQRQCREATAKLESCRATAPAYFAKMQARIKELGAAGTTEGNEDQTLTGLNAALLDITAAADVNVRAGKEGEAQTEKLQAEKAQSEYESNLLVFTPLLESARTAVKNHPEGDASQIKDLEGLASRAATNAKAKKFDVAAEQIKNAVEMARRVVATPQGLKASSRDNLPAVEKRWKEAVGAFNSGVSSCRSGITNKSRDDAGVLRDEAQQTSLKLIDKQLEELTTTFNAAAFEAPIKVLARRSEPLKVRRAAREKALTAVRSYLVRVDKDPLLMVLFTNNPFATVQVNLMKQALRDLDLNIQRCL